MSQETILIISGGQLDEKFAKEYMMQKKFSKIIAVDGGLVVADNMNLAIDYIVGDFDTVSKELLDKYNKLIASNSIKTIVKEFNPEKDVTDTQIALELAISLKPSEIILLGATGTRLDHTLGNINLLMLPLLYHIEASMIDQNNKIYLIDKEKSLNKTQLYGRYISLLPLTESVEGVTLSGFKYPLYLKTLTIGNSLGISNEVIEDRAFIQVKKGILIIIEAND